MRDDAAHHPVSSSETGKKGVAHMPEIAPAHAAVLGEAETYHSTSCER